MHSYKNYLTHLVKASTLMVCALFLLLSAHFAHAAEIDLGLRFSDGSETYIAAIEPFGTLTSPLRISDENGDVYGVILVDVSDPDALPVRIQTSGGTKAIKKYNPFDPSVITSCEELQKISYYAGYPGSEDYTIDPDPAKNYGNNYIDCRATNPANPENAGSVWDATTGGLYYSAGGKGFLPLAISSVFTGSIDGQGNKIVNLFIDRRTSSDYGYSTGLISYGSGASISNLGLQSTTIKGETYVGGLVASCAGCTITNSYVKGTVNGYGPSGDKGGLVGRLMSPSVVTNSYTTGTMGIRDGYLTGGVFGSVYGSTIDGCYSTATTYGKGGLAGTVDSSTITNSYTTGRVIGKYGGSMTGGLVGYVSGASSITNSYATGNVTAGDYGWHTGGLVGVNSGGSTITNSYATGNVFGDQYNTGGLVGKNDRSTITKSYASGDVDGLYDVGGLVGYNDGNITALTGSTITNSYATGNVTGTSWVGGFAGLHQYNSKINRSYSTGLVTAGGQSVGGFIGRNISSTQAYSYYNYQSSGQANPVGSGSSTGVGKKTTTQMKQQGTYTGFNFTTPIWKMISGRYACLNWQTNASCPIP